MSDGTSFFGLDLQKGDPRLNGTLIDCSGTITPEMIQETMQRMIDAYPSPPCGSKESPHLVRPRPIGQITYCISCGYAGVRVSETEMRPLNEEELQAGVKAMNRALRRVERNRRKAASGWARSG